MANFLYETRIHKNIGNYAQWVMLSEPCDKIPDFRLENNQKHMFKLYILTISLHVFKVMTQNKFNVLNHLF